MIDLPRRLLEAIHDTVIAFEKQGLGPPTCMEIGEDIQCLLLASGAFPWKGSWGTVCGMELRGVSDAIQRRLDERRSLQILLRDYRTGLPTYTAYQINSAPDAPFKHFYEALWP